MAGMQFMGTMPRRQSALAKVLEKGTAGVITGMEKGQQQKLDLSKVEYTKKKGAVDIAIKALDNTTPVKRSEALGDDSPIAQGIVNVYGQEALDALRNAKGGGMAKKVAKVTTWIREKKKPSPMTGIALPLTDRGRAKTEIALELSDADWMTNYPDLAAEFEASYPTTPTVKKKPKKPLKIGGESVGGIVQKGKLALGAIKAAAKLGRSGRTAVGAIKNMSEEELFNRAMKGDTEAISEAQRRGYPIGR